MKFLTQKKHTAQLGFTLVEMMVSLALFTVVMTAGTGTMLVVLNANRKAQSFQTAMDNLGIALDGISRDMRVGTHYQCSGHDFQVTFTSNTNTDCDSSGGFSFAFLPLGAVNNDNNYWVYRFNDGGATGRGSIERCKLGNGCSSGTNGVGSTFSPITAPEINIKFFRAYLTHSDPATKGDLVQSKIRIVIEGVAGMDPKTQTEFGVQTTISQFQLDL
jgi:prepilin-type N-terminal cleavage/methylation domain-containing protein